MNSVLKRVLLTITSVPALFSLIYFFPQNNHLVFALLTVGAVIIGSLEMKKIFFKESSHNSYVIILSSLLPVIAYIEQSLTMKTHYLPLYMILVVSLIMSIEVFIGNKEQFSTSIDRVSRAVLLFVYPGIFAVFLIYLLFLEHTSFILILLFLLVFANDTFAYVFGMLFGKNNRNIVQVSPNKSVAGFIGGLVMTVVVALLYQQLVPKGTTIIPTVALIFLAIIISIISNLGDLVESMYKRGAQIKDSGSVILGRGGLMDSIDSLLLSTPFFYFFLSSL
jgi:phosphatidate cytidylyltransferase